MEFDRRSSVIRREVVGGLAYVFLTGRQEPVVGSAPDTAELVLYATSVTAAVRLCASRARTTAPHAASRGVAINRAMRAVRRKRTSPVVTVRRLLRNTPVAPRGERRDREDDAFGANHEAG